MNQKRIKQIKHLLSSSDLINDIWYKCMIGEYNTDEVILAFDAIIDRNTPPINRYKKIEKLKATMELNRHCSICGEILTGVLVFDRRELTYGRYYCKKHEKENSG